MTHVRVEGPVHAADGTVLAGSPVVFEPVGPRGQILRDLAGAVVASSTVHTDGSGVVTVDLASNDEIDQASGVAGSFWRATVWTRSKPVWEFRLATADEGSTVPFGDGTHRRAPGTAPPSWPVGAAIPSGGASGEVLAKASGADFDTQWVPQSGGSGGQVDQVLPGTNVTVDNMDPTKPIIEVLSIPAADVTGLGDAATKTVGAPGGVAGLDGAGKVPAGQLPALGGRVDTVTAADGTVTVAGTATDPTVAVGTVPHTQISGLGDSATKNVGTTAGAVAAGDKGVPAPGSNGQVLTVVSGAAAWAAPPGGGTVTCVAGSDTSVTNSTTFVAASGLTFNVTNGVTYAFRFDLYMGGGSVGKGKVSPVVTGTGQWGAEGPRTSDQLRNGMGPSPTFSTAWSYVVEFPNVVSYAVVSGAFTATADGTLELWFAQNTANATATVVRAISYGTLTTLT